MYNQERHVPAIQYKFKRERIVATLKEYMASPSFALLGGCPTVTSTTSSHRATPNNSTAVTLLATRPAGSATCYRFGRSNGGTDGGGGTCTRLALKFMFIWHNVPCVHKPFATVAQCIMNSFHRGQVIEPEP